MWCVAPLLHAKVPPPRALSPIGNGLALVEVEIETESSVVLISSNASFVRQLLGKDVGEPIAFLLAFPFSFVALVVGSLCSGPGWLAACRPIVRFPGRSSLTFAVTTLGLR